MDNLDNIFIDNAEKTVLIIDGHNIAYRCLYSTIFHNPDDGIDFYLWRHNVLNNIFNVVTKFNPDTLVLAFDEKGSWRYDYYKKYKAHRKGARENSKFKIDWKRFFEVFEAFILDIKETFTNIYTIKLPRTEGDDIIGVCANEIFKTDNIIIVSNDGDMRQLLTHSNVKVYDPKSSSIVECINPDVELKLKIIQGDSSDNITGLRRGVGPVTAEKIHKMGVYEYADTFNIKVNRKMKSSEWMNADDLAVYCSLGLDENNKLIVDNRPNLTHKEIDNYIVNEKQMIRDNYDRNCKLINLECIPDDIKNKIKNTCESYDIKKFKSKDIIGFFRRNKMLKHLTDWNNVSEHFKKLN